VIEGRTVAIEICWAEQPNERYAEIAGEFVRLNVDVIVTSSTPPAIAAKRATAVIPIVSALMGDPVGTGLVASLARPGGVVVNMVYINTLAVVARLPVIYNQRMYVEAGGLTSYGPDYRDLFRRAADFVDKDSAWGEAGRPARRAAD